MKLAAVDWFNHGRPFELLLDEFKFAIIKNIQDGVYRVQFDVLEQSFYDKSLKQYNQKKRQQPQRSSRSEQQSQEEIQRRRTTLKKKSKNDGCRSRKSCKSP